MFKNYIKTTLRSLWKNRTYSFLNLFGLAIGIAFSALIFLWVEAELDFNSAFKKRDYIYRIMENVEVNGEIKTGGSTPGPLAQAIKEEIPGITNTARLSWFMPQLLEWNETKIRETGVYADTSFPDMMTLDFVKGNSKSVLTEPDAVIISESLARRVFHNENPIGKTIKMNAGESFSVDGLFKVTGVFKDVPRNSSYQFHWVSPYTRFEDRNDWIKPWTNTLTETIVELSPEAKRSEVQANLSGFLSKKLTGWKGELILFSMNDWYLRNVFVNGKTEGGKATYVYLFSVIAFVIMLIACINFMNLATARSEKRAKEVGIRKVMGSGKSKLILQFLGESLTMTFIALFIALGIIYLVLPAYNQLVEKDLNVKLFTAPHVVVLTGIVLITGLLAGSYPAFYLSAFNPIKVLKGLNIKSAGGAVFIRKGLVVTQFTFSIALIICTLIIYQQINHIKTRDLGFTKERLIHMAAPTGIKEHFPAVKQQLISTGVVDNVAMSLHEPLHLYSSSTNFRWQGKDPESKTEVHSNTVSPEYLSTMGMKVIEGRDFYSSSEADSNSVIINKSLADIMGVEGKAGAILSVGKNDFQVIGIINDYVYNDMYGSGMPAVLYWGPMAASSMTIKLKDGVDLSNALGKTMNVIKASNAGQPLEFRFVDDDFNALFKTETLTGKLAGIFAALAILISCLGLFGLAAYTAEKRTREIGVRKVLGASSLKLATLLAKEFIQLVIISCAISFPLAWWVVNSWLQNFAYRTAIHWWVFSVAGLVAVFIAAVTVSSQAIKAALANPVRSLRTE